MPHVIRLRGPWEYEPLARTRLLPDGTRQVELDDLPPAGRIRIPADWGEALGREFRGRVRYRRRFSCPSGLEAGDRVELVIGQVDAFGAASLNGQPLLEIPVGAFDARVDITAALLPRNELCVDVELPETGAGSAPLPRPGRQQSPGGLIGEVRLEIHAARSDGDDA